MTSLREQLARFHDAITGRAPLDSARDLVESSAVGVREREAVSTSVRVDELERLRVYEYAYTARIASVLVHDYPKLAKLVGDGELREWTASYLRAYPPSNFSLREVGAHLARWLASDTEQREGARHHPVAADLARLERARTEVFDGPDATPLSRDDLATMDPAEFPSLKLRLVPSCRVVEIATNADDLWDAIENESTIEIAPTSTRTVLVWRRELTVIHRTLESDETAIIPTMITGTTFGAMCELLAEETAAERAIELLVRWLDGAILRR